MNGVENTLRQTGKLYLLQPENSFPESSSSKQKCLANQAFMRVCSIFKSLLITN
nr:MAG TPA: hypothetical protein [Caudoviricetes sp.]